MKVILLLAALFLILKCCGDDQAANRSAKAAEEARIAREVKRQVEVIEKDLKIHEQRLHTIRVVGFTVLTGAAVVGLLRLRRSNVARVPQDLHIPHVTDQFIPQMPTSTELPRSRPARTNDYHPPRTGRVIDLRPVTRPAVSPTDHRQYRQTRFRHHGNDETHRR